MPFLNTKGGKRLKKNNILIVDENISYTAKISTELQQVGDNVDCVQSILAAIEALNFASYNIVIIALTKTEEDSIDLLRYIKNVHPTTKTMILTNSPSEDTELTAVNIGVDRYLNKQIRLDLLLKYIAILFEDITIFTTSRLAYKLYDQDEQIEINLASRTITKNGNIIKLTPKEYILTTYLLTNKGRAISREELIKELWDENITKIDHRIIDVHIKSIRQKLAIPNLLSVRGFGYKWE